MSKILRNFSVLVFSLVGVLLMFRFVLKFFGANPSTPFVDFIYQNTQPLLAPFLYAFPTPSISGRFVIEFTTLFALFVYAFISYIIEEVLNIFDRESRKKER